MGSCGEWAMVAPTGSFTRFYCGGGLCHRPECKKLFYARRVRLLSELIKEYGLIRFFTLTLNREYCKNEDAWEYIHYPWSKMRKRLRRLSPSFKFVAILERHKNENYPHIHGFTNFWLEQRHWSILWDECKGGSVVWVEKVKDDGSSEYVSKQLDVSHYVGKENLSGGYKEKRRYRTLWRTEKMRASFELQKEEGWSILKESVFNEEGDLRPFWKEKEGDYVKAQQQRKNLARTCSAPSAQGVEARQ